jgi:MYXO-CTERM domain-containing protein
MKRLMAALALLALDGTAHGFGGGVSGYSGKPGSGSCNDCHSGGPAPTTKLTGPAQLAPGEQQTYTLEVATGSATRCVGFDVAASDGTIGTVSQKNESVLQNNELTHTRNWPKGDPVQVQFSLTAPAAPGMVTLFANGLNSDCNDDSAGDNAAPATLAVAVVGAAVDLAGTVPPDMAAPPVKNGAHDEARWDCGCRVGGDAGSPPIVVVLVLALFGGSILWRHAGSRAAGSIARRYRRR